MPLILTPPPSISRRAGRRWQKDPVLEEAGEVNLALVVDGQLNVLLGEVGKLALLEHAVELGLSLVAGAGAVVGVAQVAAQCALELIGIGGTIGQSSVDLVDLGRGERAGRDDSTCRSSRRGWTWSCRTYPRGASVRPM